MSEKQKFAKSEKYWHSCQKPSKILKFVLKSLQKKLCYIEEQLQEIQICKKPNYKYQVHMHHNTIVGRGTNYLMFLIVKFSILILVEYWHMFNIA